ncbi:hypothetical protein M885DRAFT_535094 [Pelagophyceae sp. CCMP2097]|nr:hypothetical protein M885DRAFT_535094 [Pelagophyceae sp. CCMP2097]
MDVVEELTARLLADEDLASVTALAQGMVGAPGWATSLIAAAGRRVSELEQALGATRDDVSRLRARAEAIVAENEELYARLNETLAQRVREDDGSERSPFAPQGDTTGAHREMAVR